MSPAEEDALAQRIYVEHHYEESPQNCLIAAIRAAVKAEQANRRCTITGNPCLTDTWCGDQLPDCHCGRIYKHCEAEKRAAVAAERERCARVCEDGTDSGEFYAAAIRRG